MLNNSRWKGIQSAEALEKFLLCNTKYIVVDTGDPERRFFVRHYKDAEKTGGISVDGRSVRALQRSAVLNIRKVSK